MANNLKKNIKQMSARWMRKLTTWKKIHQGNWGFETNRIKTLEIKKFNEPNQKHTGKHH